MSSVLEHALKYAAFGWPVFPCAPGGKRPITQHGLLDAATDPVRIRRIFTSWPTANIAVCTGRTSGIVVLDVDGEEGFDSLHAKEAEHGPILATASVKTPRGGQHYYFKHPGREVRNSASQLAPGLDVRGDGGYVLVPPSRIGERAYEPDERGALAPLPRWIMGEQAQVSLFAGARVATPVSEWIDICHGVNEGGRNHAITRLVGHLLHKDVDARLVVELAQLVNGRCRPPLPPQDVERICESIAGRELRRRKEAA